MLTKEKLLAFIEAMPEEKFDHIDILLERILLLDKVEKGSKDIEEGNEFSMEEARQKLQKWLK